MAEFKERLANLQALYDDGLITQTELQARRKAMIDSHLASSVSPPVAEVATPAEALSAGEHQAKRDRILRWALVGLVVVPVPLWLLISALSGALWDATEGGSATTAAVETSSAQAEVDATLLGDAWIGSGSYTILATAKATGNAAGGPFQVYAARIDAPGAENLCLFWYADGARLGEGMIIGDTMTRQFSEWGSAATAGSSAADFVRTASNLPEGRAVIRAVGC